MMVPQPTPCQISEATLDCAEPPGAAIKNTGFSKPTTWVRKALTMPDWREKLYHHAGD